MRGATCTVAIKNYFVCYFNSHAPCGARRIATSSDFSRTGFQLTRPLRGATSTNSTVTNDTTFQLTRPLRGATTFVAGIVPSFEFQLTRPLRGATTSNARKQTIAGISTHTPLAGRDLWQSLLGSNDQHFNSHAPCGARQSAAGIPRRAFAFQLTRPLRGATSWFV